MRRPGLAMARGWRGEHRRDVGVPASPYEVQPSGRAPVSPIGESKPPGLDPRAQALSAPTSARLAAPEPVAEAQPPRRLPSLQEWLGGRKQHVLQEGYFPLTYPFPPEWAALRRGRR